MTSDEKFGMLKFLCFVEAYAVPSGQKKKRAKFLCDCGREHVADWYNVKKGYTKSCGCFQPARTHGHSRTETYRIWEHVVRRGLGKCHRELYWDKGIRICERWLRYENFLEDMGLRPSKKHSVDRIDGTKGYCKENCRWATDAEQARNKCNNIRLTYEGETLCLTDMAVKHGLNVDTLYGRIVRMNWDVKKAIETPVQDKVTMLNFSWRNSDSRTNGEEIRPYQKRFVLTSLEWVEFRESSPHAAQKNQKVRGPLTLQSPTALPVFWLRATLSAIKGRVGDKAFCAN